MSEAAAQLPIAAGVSAYRGRRTTAACAAALILPLSAYPARAQSSDSDPATPTTVVAHTVRTVASLPLPIDNMAAVSPDGRHYLALQTRPDPIIWILPVPGEPFSFRQSWAAFKPRWAASGSRIGFIASIGPPRIWTVEVDSTSSRPIDPPRMLIRTSANAFAFSPDGTKIALVSSRSTAAGASEIRIVDWKSRSDRRRLREDGVIYWLDWSRDGASIYYGLAPNSTSDGATHEVRRVPVGRGKTISVRRVGEFLGLAPDGTRILYRPLEFGGGEDNVFEVAGVVGGEPLRFELPPGPAPRWGASASSLVLVRRGDASSEILEIALPRSNIQ